jgi:hypothetical protein
MDYMTFKSIERMPLVKVLLGGIVNVNGDSTLGTELSI